MNFRRAVQATTTVSSVITLISIVFASVFSFMFGGSVFDEPSSFIHATDNEQRLEVTPALLPALPRDITLFQRSSDPADFDISVNAARKDIDTHTGYWDVVLTNRSQSDGTLAVVATSSIGTIVTETTGECVTTDEGWDCDVAANSELTITFATSIEFICGNSRVRMTVNATVDGQSIIASNPSLLLTHREFNCPDIRIADPQYDTESAIASWSVTVDRRLLDDDPGIDIFFDPNTSFTGLPTGCSASSSVVACQISTFANRQETFTANQTLGRECSGRRHVITATARINSDHATVPVSPENGLELFVPSVDPCISRIEIEPMNISVVAGSTTQVELTVYDGENSELAQLPSSAELTWTATHGIIGAETVATANYTAPTLFGDGADQITADVLYAGNRYSATAVVALMEPQNTPTATPTLTPTATNTPTATPTPSPTPTPTVTPTPLPTPTDTPTATPSPSPTPTPTVTPTPLPTATDTPTATPTPSPTPSPTNANIDRDTYSYRDTHSYRHADINANTDRDTHSYRHADANTDRDTHSYRHADADANTDTYSYCHADINANTDRDTHSYRHADANTDRDTHSYRHADADANTDTYSYCHADINANTDRDTHSYRHADANTDRDTHSYRHADANTDRDTYSYCHTDANTDRDTHSNRHADANANTDRDTYSYRHADANTDRDTYSYCHTDANTDRDTHSNRHADANANTDRDTYSYRHADVNTHSNTESHAHADAHTCAR